MYTCDLTWYIDIIHSGEAFQIKSDVKMPTQKTCQRCGYMSSNDICKACVLLEGLNRGLPQLGIGKGTRVVSDSYHHDRLLVHTYFHSDGCRRP